ncbi:WBP11 [Bugula neritina]|uniref:WBP11 n=1 Tax=Bugula neritina TaxID=10212 RepID=A0A7J7JG75_BUGNE|nr:WBP11 [Bugula neritina]
MRNKTYQIKQERNKGERNSRKIRKQRMAVRHAVLKGKDGQKIIQDLDEIDDMELNPSKPPSLGEKVLKEKRRKLMETFERVLKLYEKEDTEYYAEFKEVYDQYLERRARKQMYYDEVKSAERVLVDEIPLPDLPLVTPVAPYDIPLPQPKSILKKAPAYTRSNEHKRKPPGPPPGPPPALSDSEEELEVGTTPLAEKHRSIRFQDEEGREPTDGETEAKGLDEHTESTAKPTTPLQAAMLKMAAEKAAKVLEQSQQNANAEEVFAEHGNVGNVLNDRGAEMQTSAVDVEGAALPPAEITPGMVQPIIYRGPGGAPVVGLQLAPVAIRPPGLLPPGPPPGLPPALRVHRLPTDLPPRLVRPPMNIPPPGMRPGMQQSNILSAPPSIMKPPSSKPFNQPQQDSHATISAKPVIKHHIGDVTRFMPTSLKIKRDGQKKPVSKLGKYVSFTYSVQNSLRKSSVPLSAPVSSTKSAPGTGQTKDDAYDSFMKEIEGIM